MSNDRFRFRAWDRRRKEMLVIRDIFYYDSTNELQGITSVEGDEVHKDECILMQSTSLKDKNGKLIFEGDIVQDETMRTGEVCFENGSFHIFHIGGDVSYISVNNPWEIIGNIHRNPELLKRN